MRRCHFFALTIFAIVTTGVFAQSYPRSVKTIRYETSADQSMQSALFWAPESTESVPLLVALHTWSGDYRQAGNSLEYFEWCKKHGWAFIHPNFRGVNNTPEAVGSDLVVADIASSVDYAKSAMSIDTNRIYCVGVSGGGHASLLMAARRPEIWAGVSAWCGISDIPQWHRDCSGKPKTSKYARHIEQCLGGTPDSSKERLGDALHRSPITWLNKIEREKLPPLDINHGVDDGRKGSVPFTHSLLAWNAAVKSPLFPDTFVKSFYATQQVPDDRKQAAADITDALYGERPPIFRQRHEQIGITIFKGGHEIIPGAALTWLAAQEKGKPVNWQPPQIETASPNRPAVTAGQ